MPVIDRQTVLTAAIAATGVAVFELLALPLPFLLGPLAACLVAALGGMQLRDFGALGRLMRVVLGIAVGASVTPDLLARLPDMAVSIALVPLFIIVIGACGYPFFLRVCGYDRPTAYYAAMPGGLQDMLLFGEEAGGNVRTLSLIHATRVLAIVTIASVLLTQVWDVSLTGAPGRPAADVPVGQLVIMFVAGIVAWRAAVAVRLFGAPIIGPLIATAALSLAGVIHARPPAEAVLGAQYVLGAGIGAAYTGITFAELRRDVSAGVLFCLILALVSVAFAEAVSLMGVAPSLEIFLAYAPGGQAEMIVLALVAGADVAFVVAHHLVRMVIVIVGAPMFAARAHQSRREE